MSVDSINKCDGKCFQYVRPVALNHKETGKRLQRISKFKPFKEKFNWNGINYPPEVTE